MSSTATDPVVKASGSSSFLILYRLCCGSR